MSEEPNILTLPDGTIIGNAGQGEDTEINTPEDQSEVALELAPSLTDGVFVRTLGDIETEHKHMSAIMTVLGYAMWGLDAKGIARITNKTVDEIVNFQLSEHYTKVRKELIEALRYAETASVHGYLSQKAGHAAKVMVREMQQTRDGDRAVRAASDVLDRSGFRPVDRVEHSHKFEDELRIVHIKEDTQPMTIDVSEGI